MSGFDLWAILSNADYVSMLLHGIQMTFIIYAGSWLLAMSLAIVLLAIRLSPFRFGDPLVVGPFGTRQPDADAEALAPTFLLVPVVAFDATGVRIGHGAGYYDATLAVLRARRAVVALGCGYASQQAATLPVGAHDQRLDAIATEQGVLRA